MAGRVEWVLLAYRMPREPSTPRISVWRKLRRLGVAQVLDGLVALPLDARTKERLEWIAGEIVESGGEATLWTGRLASARAERGLIERMAARVADEYQEIVVAATAALDAEAPARRRVLARLRREHRRVAERDYFPPEARERARQALSALAEVVEVPG